MKLVEPHSDTEYKWGLNYNSIPDVIIDAAVMYGIGNSPVPPTLDEMLDRDPKWDSDVVMVWSMISTKLKMHEANDKALESQRKNLSNGKR